MNLNPIIEINPSSAVTEISARITELTNWLGLLVIGDDNPVDCRQVLQGLPLPCAGIAFITDKKLRRRERWVANLGLSQHYACPCQIFDCTEMGQEWLQQRLNSHNF